MGCYPLKEMVSRALGKCSGKERRRPSHKLVYSPPPPTYSYKRTVAKSVNFTNHNPVIIIPPEPQPAQTVPTHHSDPGPSSSPRPEVPEPKEPKRTRFAPGPKKDGNGHPQPAQHEPGPPHHGPVHHEPKPVHHGPVGHEPGPVSRGPIPYYVPSPLPWWEEGARRQEYFGGEYCSYPTPIREGIYRIATDPHRLTNIFSEENPNACTIV